VADTEALTDKQFSGREAQNVRIAKTGVHTLGLLAVVTIVSLGLRAIGQSQTAAPPVPTPPAKVGEWKATPGIVPELNAERDAPPAVYRTYVYGDRPPVHVSIARVTTLHTYRGPFSYLFDADGRVKGNQKILIPRNGEKTPLHMMAVGVGHGDLALLVHWVQPWGEDPIPEPTEAPGRVLGTTLLHQPAFVCDVWYPYRSGANDAKVNMEEVVIAIADAIDAQIKARRIK
jgi:hypothetical protein